MFSRLKQLKTYPFGLFLWLEWILLGSALLVELPSNHVAAEYSNPDQSVALKFTLSLLCMLLLGAMGLKLPKKKNFHKWLYFSTQITLIWLPVISSNQYHFLSLFSYLIVVIRNGLIFKQRQCWLANILLFLSFIPSLTFFDSFSEFQATISRYQTVTFDDYQWLIIVGAISNLILYALCIIIFWVLVHVLLREYKSQQQLAIAREQLRQYVLKAEDRATVHERNRIAREIHDSVGHVLTAQTIQLNNAIAFWDSEPTKAYQFLTEAKELVATALKEIRYSVSTLRADPLAEKSLKTAISELFQEFSSRTGMVPHYNINLTYSLAEETKLTVYRILQEALTNIAKHSEATAVIVELQTFPEHLYLLIEDNGKGFYPEQNTTGFGLQGMQERVTALKGNIKIASDLKQGCNITITIPYQTLLLINSK